MCLLAALQAAQKRSRNLLGTIAEDEYRALRANADACPLFLVPLPRGSGYVNLVWQAQGDAFIYQTLEMVTQVSTPTHSTYYHILYFSM